MYILLCTQRSTSYSTAMFVDKNKYIIIICRFRPILVLIHYVSISYEQQIEGNKIKYKT